MIDVAEITRLVLMADAAILAATSGRVYHGQVPPEIDEDWNQPEDVLPLVFIDADSDTDVTAPIVEASLTITCWAATHEAAMTLAGLVMDALGDIDREEVGTDAVYVSHFTPMGGAKNQVDVETLRRYTELGFETMMIE